ncbi:hypothetical protein ACFSZS_31810 [Seohaeicola zhoushanensis]
MAKRKRLTPPQAGYLDGAENAPAPAMRALMPASPPIARVAGDASARAALGRWPKPWPRPAPRAG